MTDNDQSSDNPTELTARTSFENSAVNEDQPVAKPSPPTPEERAFHFGRGNPQNFAGMD